MNISPKERFLDICHFKRLGDLYTRDGFTQQTVEEWVKQGAPKEIINARFQIDYFQFQPMSGLAEIKSGIYGWSWEEGQFDPGSSQRMNVLLL